MVIATSYYGLLGDWLGQSTPELQGTWTWFCADQAQWTLAFDGNVVLIISRLNNGCISTRLHLINASSTTALQPNWPQQCR